MYAWDAIVDLLLGGGFLTTARLPFYYTHLSGRFTRATLRVRRARRILLAVRSRAGRPGTTTVASHHASACSSMAVCLLPGHRLTQTPTFEGILHACMVVC